MIETKIISEEIYLDTLKRIVFEVDGKEYRATLKADGTCVEMFWNSTEKMFWSGICRSSAWFDELVEMLNVVIHG